MDGGTEPGYVHPAPVVSQLAARVHEADEAPVQQKLYAGLDPHTHCDLAGAVRARRRRRKHGRSVARGIPGADTRVARATLRGIET